MSEPADTLPDVMPSATPSEAEIAAWQALPRDEQLRRLRAELSSPECCTDTNVTMQDILEEARAAARLRRGKI